MRLILLISAFLILFTGCTFNITEKVKEITLSGSASGLTKISVSENLLEDNEIEIQGIDSQQVIVTAVARMFVLKDNDDVLDDLQLSISSGGEIGFVYPGESWSRIGIEAMSIQMDRTLDCDLKSVSGNIEISDVAGFCKVRTTSGNCEVETVEGCNIKSKSGDITVNSVYDSLQDTTKLYIESVSGDVDIYLPNDTLAFTGTVCLISVKTSSGDICITVPYGFSADLDFSTQSGDKTISVYFNDISASSNTIDCETIGGDLIIKSYTP